MSDWYTEAYEAEHRRRYEEIRAKHPGLVTKHFACNAGWFDLIERLLGEIAVILEDGDPAMFEMRQVKEKLGGLRFYYQYSDDVGINERIGLAVFAAECRSQMTCEVCGRPGLRRMLGGWISTRCDEHGTERGRRMDVTPSAEEQAAWVPEMTRFYGDGSGRYARYIYDREADSVVLVEEGG